MDSTARRRRHGVKPMGAPRDHGCVKKVHCLGVLVVDALSGPLSEYPVPRIKTQVVTESVRFMPGGGAANSGSALAQMGMRVSVFSKVGQDSNGAFLVRELERVGVDTSPIVVSNSDSTPFTFVGIHPDGNRTFIHTPGANLTFCPGDLDEKALLAADYLFYQDFWVKPRLDGKPAAQILAKAKQQGVVTMLDECWGLGPDRRTLEEVLSHVDYFFPSFDDLLAIYPGLSPAAMVGLLHDKGVSRVYLKMGHQGCLVSCGNKTWTIPSRTKQVVDTTGAGDCFDAGVIAGLIHGLSEPESAIIGSEAAAACIAHVGGAVDIPSFEALLEKGK
ncbi:MAG: carbohydrate kinase family protein [Candidatus Omnitrophica bacterium]|nr:carbohydrate kinase family protein [Candidatus Omnitrophota bacterium]